MYYSDYEGDGGELHYRLRKQRPDLKFQGGPYFSKLSVRADQNFQRKFPSGTKYFRTKIPVTGHRKRTTDKVIQRYVNVDVVTCTVSQILSRVCI